MKCPNCGAEQAESARFCGECGFLLEKQNSVTDQKARRKKNRKPRKRWKPVLIIAVCLLLVAGGVIGGEMVSRRWVST